MREATITMSVPEQQRARTITKLLVGELTVTETASSARRWRDRGAPRRCRLRPRCRSEAGSGAARRRAPTAEAPQRLPGQRLDYLSRLTGLHSVDPARLVETAQLVFAHVVERDAGIADQAGGRRGHENLACSRESEYA